MVDNYEEKAMNPTAQRYSNGSADENPAFNHKEAIREETVRQAAERGHAATDKSVLSLLVLQTYVLTAASGMANRFCTSIQLLKPDFA